MLCAGYIATVIRDVWADDLAHRVDAASLARAARIAPGVAEYRATLGRYELYAAQDPAAALTSFREAAALNPWAARGWLQVAEAAIANGELADARSATAAAVRSEPTNTDVLADAASLYLVTGDVNSAFRLFRVLLEHEPWRAGDIYSAAWRARPDVQEVLREAVPATADAHLALLSFFTGKRDATAAAAVWDKLLSLHQGFDPAATNGYFEYLIAGGRAEEAYRAWQQLRAAVPPSGKIDAGNLITDGGFEGNFINGGFGWRAYAKANVTLTIHTATAHAGSRAALVTFDGDVSGEAGLFQYLWLQPNRDYDLSFAAKTEDLRSAQTPVVRIARETGNTAYASVALAPGSTDWAKYRAQFRTRDAAGLARFDLSIPGQHTVLGRVWLGDVRLVEAP